MVSAATWLRLLPATVVVDDGPIGDEVAALLPAEQEQVKGAVEKRRREYAAARARARRALARLGVACGPLLGTPDRDPIWPDGVVGSISHMDGWCAVAVAKRADVRALGIDLEPERPLEPSLWRLIATDRERQWLESLPPDSKGCAARLLFSAKEAFYKCQFPSTRELLDFRDVELEVDLARGDFRVTLLRDAGPWRRGQSASGRHASDAGVLVTAMAWLAGDDPAAASDAPR